MRRHTVVTFLTDFDTRDPFVGICKGVIWRLAPQATIIDISHHVPSFDILRGALTLQDAVIYMPSGIHLAVVDPGVGTVRRPLVLVTQRGDYLVGPDNGLLLPAAEKLGGIIAAYALANPDFMLHHVSQTFHGRDIFAPAAAHLLSGTPPKNFGPELDLTSLVQLTVPQASWSEGVLHGEVLSIDTYGNLALTLRRLDLTDHGIEPGTLLKVQVGSYRGVVRWVSTFGAASPGQELLYEDSSWRLCLAINQGSAAQCWSVSAGMSVTLQSST